MARGPEKLASYGYGHDNDNQVNTITNHNGETGEEKVGYEYDADNRLAKVAGATAYEYNTDNDPTKIDSSTYAYNAADELEKGTGVTYTYNEVGERTKTNPEKGPATTYEYDQAGNLTSIERAKEGETPKIEDSYTYNADGLRASQSINGTVTYMAWDLSEGIPLLLADGTNNYIYGPEELPVEQINNTTGAVLYLHHDQQGSTRLITGEKGEVIGTYTYGPYGEMTGHAGTATTPLGYDAQYTSSDTGLIYLRIRVYDPSTAQLLSIDLLVPITGAPYVYASDNPLNYRDRSGLVWEEIFEAPVIPCPWCQAAEETAEALAAAYQGTQRGVEAALSELGPEELSEPATTGEEQCPIAKAVKEEREAERSSKEPRRNLPYRGKPGSTDVLDRGNGQGQIRDYGPDGLPVKDFDFGHDHGFGDPHTHDWLEGIRQPGRPIGSNE